MLAFSHNDRSNDQREFTEQLPFQPLTIQHKPPKQKSKSPARKVLMKTVTGRPVSAVKKPTATQPNRIDKPWQEAGKLDTGLFDNRLRKNELQ